MFEMLEVDTPKAVLCHLHRTTVRCHLYSGNYDSRFKKALRGGRDLRHTSDVAARTRHSSYGAKPPSRQTF